jgi:hypothetical protein
MDSLFRDTFKVFVMLWSNKNGILDTSMAQLLKQKQKQNYLNKNIIRVRYQ